MANAVEVKKRLNTIAAAAIQTFNSHKTKKDKSGAVVENNYNFAPAAKAMVQEAFDLGRQALKENVAEPIAVDQEDENPKNTEPVTTAPEAPEAP